MRRFPFRYESLLKVNRLRAEEAEREFGLAVRALQEAEQARDRLRQIKRDNLNALLEKKRQGALQEIRLLEKEGGRSGSWRREGSDPPPR